MKHQNHIGFWLALALLAFLASPLMRTGQKMEHYLVAEIAQTREAMGDTVGDMIVTFANGIFTDTPVAAFVHTASSAKHDQKDMDIVRRGGGPGGEMVANLFNSYIVGLMMQSYVFSMRLAILLIWAFVLAPVFVASVFDGLMMRAIKRIEFGSLRPATFTLAGIIVIPLLFLPVLYLVMPFSLSPLLAPAWAALVALPLSVLVSNSQPLFGR